MLLTDFCNRLTTRAPADCSIPRRVTFVDADRRPASLGISAEDSRNDGAELPFASSALGQGALDGAPSSFGPITHSISSADGEMPSPASGRRSRCRGFVDRSKVWQSVPLTLPVAPRILRKPEEHRGTRTPSTDRASTQPAFRARSAFHRQVLPSPRFREVEFLWEPATDLAT